MSIFDIIDMALRNLRKRPLRTILTVLGVIVGCCAIVIMISLGIGINKSFERQMEQMGDLTIIRMNPEAYWSSDKSLKAFDDDTIKELKKIEGVVAVTPMLNTYLYAVSGRYRAEISVIGIDPEAMPYLGYVIADGETLTGMNKFEVVFGPQVASTFAKPSRNGYMNYKMMDMSMGMGMDSEIKPKVDVLKDKIMVSFDYEFGMPNTSDGSETDPNQSKTKFKPFKVKGVGILAPDETGTNWELNRSCYMSLADVQLIIKERQKWEKDIYGGRGNPYDQNRNGYQSGLIKVSDLKYVDAVLESIKEMGFGEYDAYHPAMYTKQMKEMLGSLQTFLGIIGAVSLFIAAIGISNTMVMSIYERTKEIGVMKVIGASLRDIRNLFLTEATIIGLLGGLFGVAISYLVSYFVNKYGISFFSGISEMMYYTDDPSQKADISYIPTWLSLLALGFSMLVGLVSGLLPAFRATRLSALAAIRSE